MLPGPPTLHSKGPAVYRHTGGPVRLDTWQRAGGTLPLYVLREDDLRIGARLVARDAEHGRARLDGPALLYVRSPFAWTLSVRES